MVSQSPVLESRPELPSLPIGEKLSIMRTYRGLPQSAACKLLGVGQSAYAKYERGTTAIGVNQLVHLCREWKIDIRFFTHEMFISQADLKDRKSLAWLISKLYTLEDEKLDALVAQVKQGHE